MGVCRRTFSASLNGSGQVWKRSVPRERSWTRERSRWLALAETGIDALGQVPLNERVLSGFLERYVEYCLQRAREADEVEGGKWADTQTSMFPS